MQDLSIKVSDDFFTDGKSTEGLNNLLQRKTESKVDYCSLAKVNRST